MTRRIKLLSLLGMLALIGALHTACGPCPELTKVRSGRFILTAIGSVDAEYAWLVGSDLVIDREAKKATIRYERDGTIYDVEFDLVQ